MEANAATEEERLKRLRQVISSTMDNNFGHHASTSNFDGISHLEKSNAEENVDKTSSDVGVKKDDQEVREEEEAVLELPIAIMEEQRNEQSPSYSSGQLQNQLHPTR